jgi:hypothetical protein
MGLEAVAKGDDLAQGLLHIMGGDIRWHMIVDVLAQQPLSGDTAPLCEGAVTLLEDTLTSNA